MRVSDLELKLDLLISMAAACGPRRQMYPRCWKRLVVFQVRVDDQVYLWTKPTKCNHHQCNQSNFPLLHLPYSLSILTTSMHALIFPTFIALNHSLLFSPSFLHYFFGSVLDFPSLSCLLTHSLPTVFKIFPSTFPAFLHPSRAINQATDTLIIFFVSFFLSSSQKIFLYQSNL